MAPPEHLNAAPSSTLTTGEPQHGHVLGMVKGAPLVTACEGEVAKCARLTTCDRFASELKRFQFERPWASQGDLRNDVAGPLNDHHIANAQVERLYVVLPWELKAQYTK